MPVSTQGTRTLHGGEQSWLECETFAGRMNELLEINAQRLEAGILNERTVVEFAPAAGERWVVIANAIEAEIRPGGVLMGPATMRQNWRRILLEWQLCFMFLMGERAVFLLKFLRLQLVTAFIVPMNSCVCLCLCRKIKLTR